MYFLDNKGEQTQARGQEMGGGAFCKKIRPYPHKTESNFAFTFYLFGGRGVRTHPTHPPAYGHETKIISRG